MADVDILQELMDDKTLSSPSPYDQNQPRQRLRSWLSDQLDSETCPGCKWISQEMKVFKLTWKHYGRPGFDEDVDAKIFREWARHTKRYSPGDPSDVSTWKTRFRNALHKMPDIEEMSDYHQLDGNDPFRVYRFRTPEEMERIRSDRTPLQQQPSPFSPDLRSPGSSAAFSPGQQSPPPYPTVTMPSIITNEPPNQMNTQQREINSIKNYLEHATPEYGSNMSTAAATHVEPPWNEWNDLEDVMKVLSHQTLNNNCSSNNMQMSDPPVYVQDFTTNNDSFSNISIQAIGVKLFLSDKEVQTAIWNNTNGLRIAYKPPPVPNNIVDEVGVKEVIIGIYGPLNAKQIYYPFSDDMNTLKILDFIERGLVIQMEPNGDMYATRLCIARVFYSHSVVTAPKALARSQRTLVFSFQNDFLPSLSAYRKGFPGTPSCERFFSFGQQWNAHEPLKDVFVHCSITHFLAKKLLKEARSQKPYEAIERSVPNYLDDIQSKLQTIVLESNAGQM